MAALCVGYGRVNFRLYLLVCCRPTRKEKRPIFFNFSVLHDRKQQRERKNKEREKRKTKIRAYL